jgi:hypothetical protein
LEKQDISAETRLNHEVVSQYFTGAYVGVLESHRRRRLIMVVLRIAAAIAGLALVAITMRDLWLQKGTLAIWPLPETVMTTPAGFGVILVLAAAIPLLWRYGWELPAAFVVAGAMAEVAFLNFGDRRNMGLIAAVALVALIGAIWSRVRKRRAPLELSELEPKLDAWTETLVDRFLGGTDIPAVSATRSGYQYVVRTFPKLERSGAPRVLGRLGTDGRARISPIGVGAFILGPDTITAVEGAIDLGSERVLYRRAHEFRYGEVVSMVWTSDATPIAPDAAVPHARSSIGAMARLKGAVQDVSPRQRDTLEIRLVGGRSVSLVFADSAFLPPDRGAAAASVERRDVIVSLWRDVMSRSGRPASTAT